jgi:hypothetical protein
LTALARKVNSLGLKPSPHSGHVREAMFQSGYAQRVQCMDEGYFQPAVSRRVEPRLNQMRRNAG